jgi:hypothetical protein
LTRFRWSWNRALHRNNWLRLPRRRIERPLRIIDFTGFASTPMKNCATIRRSDRSPRTSCRSSKSAALSAGDGESQNRYVRLLRGSARVIRADRCRGVHRPSSPVGGYRPDYFDGRFPRSRQVGRTAGNRRPITPLFLSRRSIVGINSPLELSCTLRSQLFQGRIDMLRKITIAFITLAAVSLDPLLAHMEGWWRYRRRRRR